MIRLLTRSFFGIILLSSCGDSFNELDVLGTYTPSNYVETIDTIFIKKDNIYVRRLYDKNGKLLLSVKNRWTFYNEKRTQIQFDSFFINLDRDLIEYPELLSDTLGGMASSLKKTNGTLEFCVGSYSESLPNQNCYRKL